MSGIDATENAGCRFCKIQDGITVEPCLRHEVRPKQTEYDRIRVVFSIAKKWGYLPDDYDVDEHLAALRRGREPASVDSENVRLLDKHNPNWQMALMPSSGRHCLLPRFGGAVAFGGSDGPDARAKAAEWVLEQKGGGS